MTRMAWGAGLATIAADGSVEERTETWDFSVDGTYTWTLYGGDVGSDVWMTDTYHRR